MTQTVVLPWPPSGLNPNRRRGHWAIADKLRRQYKADCGWSLREQGIRAVAAQTVIAKWEFNPPVFRPKRNVDNAIAASKYALDALADYLGIDDAQIICRWPDGFGDPVKGGCITITIKTIN
jgi:hypothetical protein